MRKSGSQSSPAQNSLTTALSDARERTNPLAVKVGHPNGQMAVPGMKGWFWGQRMQPDGSGTLLMFYAETDAEGYPKDDFTVGQGITVKNTSETQPTHWTYEHQSGDTSTLDYVPPDGSGCSTASPGGVGNYYPNGGSGPGPWPANQNPVDDPANPYRYYNQTPGPDNPRAKYTPRRSPQPPGAPNPGDLWQSSESNVTFRRSGDYLTGKWYVESGPTSGAFALVKVAQAVTPGKIVYGTTTTTTDPDGGDLASRSDLTHYGKVLGVAIENRNSGEYCVIQQSGDLPLEHNFPKGQKLYLGVDGALSATPPASGSGHLYQQIAIAGNPTATGNPYVTVALGQPIKRT